MGHKEALWSGIPHTLAGSAHWGSTVGGDGPVGLPGEGDSLTHPIVGDLGDPSVNHWWNAWIDIGGEG